MAMDNKSMNGWAFVRNVANEQEAVLVESVLGTEGIPVQRKHKEAGGYLQVYMGMSRYGIDLFVPEGALELAEGLLNSEVLDMPEETGGEEVIKAAERYEIKRKSIVWIILMYLFLPLIVGIILNWIFY
ncbi:MAG: hypothetical protein APF77_06500 [Clostridia bacterium BRH_c25]|nr:MAG: hypothetical protein APF77_06500 [Clostridia bacterium BRH_c25]